MSKLFCNIVILLKELMVGEGRELTPFLGMIKQK